MQFALTHFVVLLQAQEDIDFISKAVQFNLLFQNVSGEHRNKLIGCMYLEKVKQGRSVIVQGTPGDLFYVVKSGEFNVLVNDSKVAVRGAGTCFGELALMYNSARAATVKAAVDSEVWCIDRYTFRSVVVDATQDKTQNYLTFLNEVELLQPLSHFERTKIAEAIEEVDFNAGVVVCKQVRLLRLSLSLALSLSLSPPPPARPRFPVTS